MQIRVGMAKVPKFGVSESGDTLEVVERRNGGLSIVVADGQGSGPAAKRISNLVVSRAIALISEGARDGAVARAVHDVLFALRDGKVSCELTIVSADLRSRTVVVSRNSAVPVYVVSAGGLRVLAHESRHIGMGEGVKPVIAEFPLEPGLLVVACTDGVLYSGVKCGRGDAAAVVAEIIDRSRADDAEELAGRIVSMAIDRDRNTPHDDMTAVALGVSAFEEEHRVRTMSARFPV